MVMVARAPEAASTRARRPRIGVLAIQGDVAEHLDALARCGADATAVRRPSDLDGLDGIILPGGESTAIGMLAREDGVLAALKRYVDQGGAVWGTCAGLILLARDAGHSQPLIGALDVTVDRNAFGPQVFSFETDLAIAGLAGGPFRAVFIRAPAISAAGPGVEVLARLDDGRIVAVRQGRLLATAFHPELTGDDRLHRWFVELSGLAMFDPVAHAERQAPSPRRAMRADPSPNSGGGEVNHDEPIRYPPPELGEGQAGQRPARAGGFTGGTPTSPRKQP